MIKRMQLLLTGCAGFIGAKVTELLLKSGHTVVGIDNLNDYYDVKIKELRLKALQQLQGNWNFVQGDIEDKACLEQVFKTHTFDAVYHIAARAGVRASMETPHVLHNQCSRWTQSVGMHASNACSQVNSYFNLIALLRATHALC